MSTTITKMQAKKKFLCSLIVDYEEMVATGETDDGGVGMRETYDYVCYDRSCKDCILYSDDNSTTEEDLQKIIDMMEIKIV